MRCSNGEVGIAADGGPYRVPIWLITTSCPML
jgi:hypothetical protein